MDFYDFPRFLGKSGCQSHPPKLCASLMSPVESRRGRSGVRHSYTHEVFCGEEILNRARVRIAIHVSDVDPVTFTAHALFLFVVSRSESNYRKFAMVYHYGLAFIEPLFRKGRPARCR